MKHFYLFVIFLLATSASAATSPKAAVEELNRGILQSKTDDSALLNAVKKGFDLERIAVLSIGKARWKDWSKAERKNYKHAFTSYLVAVYQDRFKEYQGGGLDIYKVQASGKRALVYSRIEAEVDEGALSKNKPIEINFSVYQKRNNWLINDVYFKGTISEVAGFRAQFALTLKKQGKQGLIDEITKKCKAFGALCNL